MRRIPPYLLVALCGLLMFVLGVVTLFASVGFQSTDQLMPTVMAMLTQMPEPAVATQLAQMGYVLPPDAQATAQTMYEQGLPIDVIANSLAIALADTEYSSGESDLIVPTEVQPLVVEAPIVPDVVQAQPTAVELIPLPTAIEVIPQPTAEDVVPLPTVVGDIAQPPTLEDAEQPASDAINTEPTAVEDVSQPTTVEVVPTATENGTTPQLSAAQAIIPLPTTEGIVPPAALIEATAQPTDDMSVLPPTVLEEVVPTENLAPEATVPGDVGNISGSILYSDRATGEGISLILTRPDGSTLNIPPGGDGAFAFAGMQPGNYTLDAAAAGYISARAEFMLTAGQNLILTSGTLMAGDTNADGVIDLLDAALVASNFGASLVVPQADLNHDGQVDVRDLTMIGSEFGLTGPISWN